MDIKKISLDKLKEAPYNPRKDLTENDIEYQKLKRSIQEFGYIEPIIVNAKNNIIVGGHQRYKVLKELGYTEIECVLVNFESNIEKACNLALNKIDGSWDKTKMKDLIEELDTGEIDLSITGFAIEEIEKLMNQFYIENTEEEIIPVICPNCKYEIR